MNKNLLCTIILGVVVVVLSLLLFVPRKGNSNKELKVVNNSDFDYIQESHQIKGYTYSYKIIDGEIVDFVIEEVK